MPDRYDRSDEDFARRREIKAVKDAGGKMIPFSITPELEHVMRLYQQGVVTREEAREMIGLATGTKHE